MNVKPCPCCGNTDLYTACLGAMRFGVKCLSFDDKGNISGCGLEMGKTIPDRRPKGCKTLKDTENWTLRQAIAAWNKRAKV